MLSAATVNSSEENTIFEKALNYAFPGYKSYLTKIKVSDFLSFGLIKEIMAGKVLNKDELRRLQVLLSDASEEIKKITTDSKVEKEYNDSIVMFLKNLEEFIEKDLKGAGVGKAIEFLFKSKQEKIIKKIAEPLINALDILARDEDKPNEPTKFHSILLEALKASGRANIEHIDFSGYLLKIIANVNKKGNNSSVLKSLMNLSAQLTDEFTETDKSKGAKSIIGRKTEASLEKVFEGVIKEVYADASLLGSTISLMELKETTGINNLEKIDENTSLRSRVDFLLTILNSYIKPKDERLLYASKEVLALELNDRVKERSKKIISELNSFSATYQLWDSYLNMATSFFWGKETNYTQLRKLAKEAVKGNFDNAPHKFIWKLDDFAQQPGIYSYFNRLAVDEYFVITKVRLIRRETDVISSSIGFFGEVKRINEKIDAIKNSNYPGDETFKKNISNFLSKFSGLRKSTALLFSVVYNLMFDKKNILEPIRPAIDSIFTALSVLGANDKVEAEIIKDRRDKFFSLINGLVVRKLALKKGASKEEIKAKKIEDDKDKESLKQIVMEIITKIGSDPERQKVLLAETMANIAKSPSKKLIIKELLGFIPVVRKQIEYFIPPLEELFVNMNITEATDSIKSFVFPDEHNINYVSSVEDMAKENHNSEGANDKGIKDINDYFVKQSYSFSMFLHYNVFYVNNPRKKLKALIKDHKNGDDLFVKLQTFLKEAKPDPELEAAVKQSLRVIHLQTKIDNKYKEYIEVYERCRKYNDPVLKLIEKKEFDLETNFEVLDERIKVIKEFEQEKIKELQLAKKIRTEAEFSEKNKKVLIDAVTAISSPVNGPVQIVANMMGRGILGKEMIHTVNKAITAIGLKPKEIEADIKPVKVVEVTQSLEDREILRLKAEYNELLIEYSAKVSESESLSADLQGKMEKYGVINKEEAKKTWQMEAEIQSKALMEIFGGDEVLIKNIDTVLNGKNSDINAKIIDLKEINKKLGDLNEGRSAWIKMLHALWKESKSYTDVRHRETKRQLRFCDKLKKCGTKDSVIQDFIVVTEKLSPPITMTRAYDMRKSGSVIGRGTNPEDPNVDSDNDNDNDPRSTPAA